MQDFKMYEGDTKKIVVSIEEDLTGASIKWGFADTVKESGNGINIISGGFEVNLIPEDTEGKVAVHNHEAEVTDAQGNVSTVLRGKLHIMRDIV